MTTYTRKPRATRLSRLTQERDFAAFIKDWQRAAWIDLEIARLKGEEHDRMFQR